MNSSAPRLAKGFAVELRIQLRAAQLREISPSDIDEWVAQFAPAQWSTAGAVTAHAIEWFAQSNGDLHLLPILFKAAIQFWREQNCRCSHEAIALLAETSRADVPPFVATLAAFEKHVNEL